MAPRYVPAYNPTLTPVLVDAEGRQIAGGEWGVADTEAVEVSGAPATADDDAVIGALERGDLILRPELLDREKVGAKVADVVEAARDLNKPAKATGTAKKVADTPTPPVEPQE